MLQSGIFVWGTSELETLYGPSKVEGTALLLKRTSELKVIHQMEQLKGTDVYLKAFLGGNKT